MEPDRPGQLDAGKAAALGAKGPMLGKLKNGIAVQLEDGRTITPEEVVGPPIPGRTIAVLQDGKRLLDLNRKCKLISNAFKYADEDATEA